MLHNLFIVDYGLGHPGSVHDAYVFQRTWFAQEAEALIPENHWVLMQLAIDEDRRCRSWMRAEEIKLERRGSDDWVRRYHQWQSRINQGSTQVNSTGVYQAMYRSLYTVQGRAWTKLCYCYLPIAKEELGKGLPAMNGKGCAYQGYKAEMKRREAQHSH